MVERYSSGTPVIEIQVVCTHGSNDTPMNCSIRRGDKYL
jgi:hypothetical protein